MLPSLLLCALAATAPTAGDAKLLKLLKLTKDDKLTYFNLQKYLNVHYLKTEKVPVATA